MLLMAGCISSTQDNNNSHVDLCGNGVINPGEQCDDGNTTGHDGCNSVCEVEAFCANNVVEVGEECDDGNYVAGDGCDALCRVERGCGNGRLDVGEQCDDDNLTDGDGCSALCLDDEPGALCGNSIHEIGEGCDDGNVVGGDGCDEECEREDGCGNGTVDASEMCDDNNNISGDGCSYECRVEFVCGNEVCEAANYETCDLCPADCCPDCGDGVLDPGEECDDGNNDPDPGDGCDKGCRDTDGVAICGNGIWEAGEECEDGNSTIHDGCSDTCEMEFVCGDQQCDDHMGETCQRCPMDCCPNCGNGVREAVEGEECDGLDLGGRTCEQECYEGGSLTCTPWCTFDFTTCSGTPPACGDGFAECTERCDGADLKGKTCQSVGYTTGTLDCTGSCGLDVSGCSGLVWYLNEDFADPLDVQNTWTLLGDWEVGEPNGIDEEPDSAYEGSLLLGTNINSDYSINQAWRDNMAITPPMHLVAATQPMLVLQLWGSSSTSDGYNVWITTNGGFDWAVLPDPNLPYDGVTALENCWRGVTTHQSWNEVIFDLSDFIGDTIQIAFSLYSNSSTNYSGMYVDKVLVTEAHLVEVEITSDPNLRRGSEAQPYQAHLQAKGGTGVYNWSILSGGVNDSWLSIDPVTGTLSGTPMAINVGSVEVTVRCEESTFTQNFQEVTFSQEIVTPEPIPYQTDFDSGHPGAWILDVDWEWGTPSSVGPAACLNGSSCIATQIDANHSDSMAYDTCVAEPPPIDLAGAVNPTLSFYQWFYTYAYSALDGGNLQISSDGGSNWTIVTPTPAYDGLVSGEQAYYGDKTSLGWHRVLADLTPWTGQVVNLRFSFVSNVSTNNPGWYVDAVSVTEAGEVPIQMTSGQDLGLALIGLPFSRPLTAEGGPPVLAWSIQPGGTNDGWLSIDPATGVLDGTPLAANQGPGTVIVRVQNPSDPSNFDEQSLTVDVVQGVWQEDFDAAGHGWTLNSEWGWGVPSGSGPSGCFSGSCIGVQMTGVYSNNLVWGVCTATSPAIDLTAAVAPLLQFRSWVSTEGSSFDGGNLKISTDGVTFTRVDAVTPAYNLSSVGGQPAWGEDNLSWNQVWYSFLADLSAWAGQTVYLRFDFRTDSSVTYPGWYIDDVTILD